MRKIHFSSGVSTFVSRFRGESAILEYSLAGLLTGTIYKFGLGPKGMISGGFFGTVLGTFAGLAIYGLTKMTGITVDELYKAAHLYFRYKDSNFHLAFKVRSFHSNKNFFFKHEISHSDFHSFRRT